MCQSIVPELKVKSTKMTKTKKVLSIFIATLLAFWSLSAQAATVSNPIQFTSDPMLTMDPNGVTPLAGVVELTANVPVRITLEFDDGSSIQTIEFYYYATNHTLPVLGLKPDRSYSILVTATDKLNNSLELYPPLQTDTAPLPNDFPTISVIVSRPDKMEPGLTLIDRLSASGTNSVSPYVIIFDNTGDVVWYSPTVGGATIAQLTNGNLLWRDSNSIIEADLLGNNIQQITAQDSQEHELSLHHELYQSAHGTFFSLSRETTEVSGYPTSDSDPDAPTQTADIEDNPVVEIGSEGQLLNIWPLTDFLPPTRIGYGALRVGRRTGAYDWAHANAVYHSESDDSLLVSVRHQDVVLKFSRSTGELNWILGPHANWPIALQKYLLQPVGTPFAWQYHQHAMMTTHTGNILMFDNYNYGASPFDGKTPIPDKDNCSRAAEYEVDEANMTIRQVWTYGADLSECFYSPSRGDADYLPETGNVLMTFSDVRFVGGIPSADLGFGKTYTRIIEVDHNTPAEKVFDLVLYNSELTAQIIVYRADRIPSLYPMDSDGDGIPDDVEDLGPNGGDGNEDSVPDRLQANVATLKTYDDHSYVTLESSGGTTITKCQAVSNPSPDDAPFDVDFQDGFFSFNIDGVAPGGTVSLILNFHSGTAPDTYWKYGFTPNNQTDHWYKFLYDGNTGADIDGNKITLHFENGERGDDDLDPDNTVIVDVGGPGFVDDASGGGGDGGWCLITTAAYGFRMSNETIVLALLFGFFLLILIGCRRGNLKNKRIRSLRK